MKAQNTAIGILSITALLLILVIAILPSRSASQVISVKEGDFLVGTHKVTSGGDGIYIIDTRVGVIGMFAYDPTARAVQLRALRPLADGFPPQ